MLRVRDRSTVPRSLVVATAVAVGLHVLGSLALGGGGWSGRGDAAHALASQGRLAPSTGASGLKVRLASAGASQSAADEALPTANPRPLPIESEPPAAGGPASLASTYLPAEELDRGPSPEPGWILDEVVLERVNRAHMRLRLWVSETGHIDRVVVLHAEPAGEWVEQAIQPLPSTPMRPAERDGRPVASTTVVELTANLETMR